MDKKFKKYHEDIISLMDTLEEIVPEISSKRDEIFALIKTYTHYEKYSIYSNLKHWVPKNDKYMLTKIIIPKLETHGEENWGNFERNLEWVKKWAQKMIN